MFIQAFLFGFFFLFFFVLVLFLNKYPISLHWHNVTKCIQFPSPVINMQRSSVNFRKLYKNRIRKNVEMELNWT